MAHNLVGDKLLRNVSDSIDNVEEHLKGKVVAFYFSAHWCPPCRAFSPMFYEVYKQIKNGPNGDKFEVIFVSSDQDQNAFNNYYGHHPWAAIPYDQVSEKLSQRFGIRGIPTVVVVNQNGDVITMDGRRDVMMKKEKCIEDWLTKN